MSDVADLERAVRELSAAELREFREWFIEFDAELRARHIERNDAAGRLAGPVDKALAEHRRKRTRCL